MTVKVKDIAEAIEAFAPRALQESYDNAGLQVGDPEMQVQSVLVCLDVTEDVIKEAVDKECNLIVSHHPVLFSGLKQITGATVTQRIVIEAIRNDIAIYSAHTNLDSTFGGVSYELAHELGLKDIRVLEPKDEDKKTGLGVVGNIKALPKLEFMRKVRDEFGLKSLRYSDVPGKLVVRRVAVCGGSGASLIKAAIASGADAYVTGDIKYHDFTSWGSDIMLADIGHYESELCAEKILTRVIRNRYPDIPVIFSELETSPIMSL